MTDHLTPAQIADVLAGAGPLEDRERWLAHCADCEPCRRELVVAAVVAIVQRAP